MEYLQFVCIKYYLFYKREYIINVAQGCGGGNPSFSQCKKPKPYEKQDSLLIEILELNYIAYIKYH